MSIVKKLGTVQGYVLFGLIYIIVVGIYAALFFLYVAVRNMAIRTENKKTYWITDVGDECDALTQVQRQF